MIIRSYTDKKKFVKRFKLAQKENTLIKWEKIVTPTKILYVVKEYNH